MAKNYRIRGYIVNGYINGQPYRWFINARNKTTAKRQVQREEPDVQIVRVEGPWVGRWDLTTTIAD